MESDTKDLTAAANEQRVTHTPGPWSQIAKGPWICGPRGETVALMASFVNAPMPLDAAERLTAANARLIAAAPDLYAVLREAVDAFDARTASGDVLPPSVDVADRVARARAVLAKVEGKVNAS